MKPVDRQRQLYLTTMQLQYGVFMATCASARMGCKDCADCNTLGYLLSGRELYLMFMLRHRVELAPGLTVSVRPTAGSCCVVRFAFVFVYSNW